MISHHFANPPWCHAPGVSGLAGFPGCSLGCHNRGKAGLPPCPAGTASCPGLMLPSPVGLHCSQAGRKRHACAASRVYETMCAKLCVYVHALGTWCAWHICAQNGVCMCMYVHCVCALCIHTPCVCACMCVHCACACCLSVCVHVHEGVCVQNHVCMCTHCECVYKAVCACVPAYCVNTQT